MNTRAQFSTEQSVVIESYTHDGRGIATLDTGRKVFVPGALAGEKISISNLKRRRNYATADIDQIQLSSIERINARCEHFGICGGCQLQHMNHSYQLATKSKLLVDAFYRLAKIDNLKLDKPVVESPWHYRRKARLGVRLVPKKGGVLVGFRERASSYVTQLNFCHVLDQKLSACMPKLVKTISELSIPDRVPQVEIAASEDRAAFVFRHLTAFTESDVKLLENFANRTNSTVYLQPGGPESLVLHFPKKESPLYYNITHGDVRVEFGPLDFVQVNKFVNQAMIEKAIEWLELGSRDHLLDLFCGIGNFTLPLARFAGCVVGIEGAGGLVEQARRNAAINDLDNSSFITADLEQIDVNSVLQGQAFNTILIDPPRSGALNVVNSIQDIQGVEKILYVSCNPETLARDASILVHVHKYSIQKAVLIDMFPHTSHSEAMVLFTR